MCENKCRRSKLDKPLAIRGVKRFMVEKESNPVLPEVRKDEATAKRKIAVIGGGPAGLSCAYFLARMGYKPTVFEAEKQTGGMLVQTIPAYRLTRKALHKEIKMIQGMGVQIKTGVALGRDFSLKQLKDKGYQAVFLGIGAAKGTRLGIPGDDARGVVDGIQFLREYNLKGKTTVAGNVAVIGGGNAAIDVARTALRLGSKSVTVIYRRTREEMPAWAEEVDEAIREGVKFEILTAPREIVTSNGKATGVKCSRMQLGEFDRSGRRRPTEKTGTDIVIDADQIVAAIGQAVDASGIVDGSGLKVSKGNFIEADPLTGQTSVEWIFAGGDAVSGPASVIEAVGAGERAAVGIDKYLTGSDHGFWRTDREVDTFFDPDADPVMNERAEIRLVPVEKRKSFDEVELVWNEQTAVREAKRCLRCDYRGKCQ